jgi:hypothetical protein
VNLKIARSGSFLDLLVDADIIERGQKAELVSLSKEGRADLIQMLDEPKSGIEYGAGKRRFYKLVSGIALKKSGQGKAWRASAPGEAPAVRTGTMRRNVRAIVPRKSGGFSSMVFVDRRAAFYRFMLELGTVNIAPRPAIGPLVSHYESIAPGRLQAALDKSVDRVNANQRP